jgi:hypothetical protein
MSTSISTRNENSKHAIDRADVTVYVLRQNTSIADNPDVPKEDANAGLAPVGIAKSFSFNNSKPKSPIHVLSQLSPAGFARDPENKSFTMTELATFEQIEHVGYFTSSNEPFVIRIVHAEKTDRNGDLLDGAKQKIIQLEGVEFDNQDYSVDANTSEYIWNFTGMFTDGYITGDIDFPFDPVTGNIVASGVKVMSF